MREIVLVETLAALHPARAVEELDALLAAARSDRSPQNLAAVEALAGAVGRVSYELASVLYEAAKVAGLADVARLFFAIPPGDARPPEPEQLVPGTGRKLTLGERKALARRGRGEMLALLQDPDAAVIRNLLENPRVTEKDVITVAARRPARPDVQRAVFASRWRARYHVRRALVMNPGTPGDLALRLVATLLEADLRAVAADVHLAEPVRAQARLSLDRPRASPRSPR